MKQFILIEDINPYLSDDGVLNFVFYNCEGAVLAAKGQKPGKKINNIEVFVKKSDYIPGTGKDLEDKSSASDTPKIPDSRHRLEKEMGAAFLTQIENHIESISEVFSNDVTPETIKKSEVVLESACKGDRQKINRCLTELRTSDQYLHIHSLSVSILFAQALDDIQKHNMSNAFFDAFKEKHNKVLFTDIYKKKYILAAFLHDYGMTKISPSVLYKKGPLSASERAEVEMHPITAGVELQKAGIEDPFMIEIVHNHHSAYLKEKNMPRSQLSVICNIVDIYDALRTDRPFRPAMSYSDAIALLEKERERFLWNDFVFEVLIKETFPSFEKILK